MKVVSLRGELGREATVASLWTGGKEKTDLGDLKEENTEFNIHLG